MIGISGRYLMFSSIIILVFFVVYSTMGYVSGESSVNGTVSNLTIWDDTDSTSKYSGYNITFYANYSTISGNPISGNCTLRFNYAGNYTVPAEMTYNSGVHEYNSSFNYKGNFTWFVNCEDPSYDILNTTDNFMINNSRPRIPAAEVSGFLPSKTVIEDNTSTFIYNFSADCTDSDLNDLPLTNFSYDPNSVSGFDCFWLNSTTGIVETNCTYSNQSGLWSVRLIVTDSDGVSDIATKNFTIVAANDAPQFSPSLSDMNTTQYQRFLYDINATDEENNTPFFFNLTFINHSQLFYINSTTGLINYTPINESENGNYTINVTVMDSLNASRSVLINFSVINSNDPPVLDYICDNKRNATEDSLFNCTINATDPDNDTLNFSTNTSWFTINSSSGVVNFTPTNSEVGNHSINITVTDSNNNTDSEVINFTVINTNDPPVLSTIPNLTAITRYEFTYTINASDDDLLTPVSDTLTFSSNSSLFTINPSTGLINYTADLPENGSYFISISVNDSAGASDSQVINFTVVIDYAPNITATVQDQNVTQGDNLVIIINATDPENDTLIFSTNNSLFSITTNDSSYPTQPVMGIMNYTPVNNSQVGNYSVLISVKDPYNLTDSQVVQFTVHNINDLPVLNDIPNFNATEDVPFNYTVSANDTDLSISVGEFLTYWSNSSLFTVNSTTGYINFTPNISDIGSYSINISVNDSFNASDSQVINFTVLSRNDPPVLAAIPNFTVMVGENLTYYVNATDEENDTLTFSDDTLLFDINSTTGLINFTANTTDVGSYDVNISVTDGRDFDFAVVNFLVRYPNRAPNITYWYPSSTDVSAAEGGSKLFQHTSSDLDNDTLTYSWRVDGVENGTNTFWLYRPSYESSGERNITLIVSDPYNGTATHYWNVSVNNTNRAPYLAHNVTNQTWSQNSANSNIVLNLYFSDPDNENNVTNDDNNITYTANISDHINVSIDQTSTRITLTPEQNWDGWGWIIFTANDSELTVNSNNVTLNVTYIPPVEVPQYIATTTTVIASLSIIIPSSVNITDYNITIVPIILKNTGSRDLYDINLSTIADSDELSVKVGSEFFEEIETRENISTNLTIISYNLTKNNYVIKINADVDNPELSEEAKININRIKVNITKIEYEPVKEIEFAKDLFEENPECMELMELIFQAEEALNKSEIEKAKILTKAAIDNCRDLINYAKRMPKITTKQPIITLPFDNPVIIALIIIPIIIAISLVWKFKK